MSAKLILRNDSYYRTVEIVSTEKVSNCCGADLDHWFEEPVCSKCGEHCDAEELPF